MSGKYNEDQLARMAGLGPRPERSRSERSRPEGDGPKGRRVVEQEEQVAGLGPKAHRDQHISDTETVPTKVAARVSDGPPSQVTLSFREALTIIGVSRNTLYSLLARRVIPGVRKLGGTWRFHRQTLLDWLACK